MKPGRKRSQRNMVRDTKREVILMGPIYRQAPEESLGKRYGHRRRLIGIPRGPMCLTEMDESLGDILSLRCRFL